ncbi:MAG TPA: hypothetical protein VGZ02_11055 [Candidatus Baltobacteraceae bacterium]|jgi:hypothetical protein|nr:hypothetical protein [Candidatus Baltobacteraceae bacterium]
MFDIAGSLIASLHMAAQRVSHAARETALAQTSYGNTRTDGPMAGAARQAIFTEALLSAVHARLMEIKDVTR